jgi:hypothetical protein
MELDEQPYFLFIIGAVPKARWADKCDDQASLL